MYTHDDHISPTSEDLSDPVSDDPTRGDTDPDNLDSDCSGWDICQLDGFDDSILDNTDNSGLTPEQPERQAEEVTEELIMNLKERKKINNLNKSTLLTPTHDHSVQRSIH